MADFNKAVEIARICESAKQNVLLFGSTGIGKTWMCHQLAEATGRKLHITIASYATPGDATGPVDLDASKEADSAVYRRTQMLPPQDNGPTLWMLDELNRAPEDVLAVLLTALEPRPDGSRYAGPHRLPDNLWIVACANYPGKSRGARPFSDAITRRFTSIDVDVDTKSWVTWAEENSLHPIIIQYIVSNPDRLGVGPDNARLAVGGANAAYPTPATWHAASRIMQVVEDQMLGVDCLFPALAGTVGEADAYGICSWTKVAEHLVPIEEIAANPEKCRLPEVPDKRDPSKMKSDPGLTWAQAQQVGRAMVNKGLTPKQGIIYLRRLGDEVGWPIANRLRIKHPISILCQEYGQWAVKFSA